MRLGEVELLLLSDGVFGVDGGGFFGLVPKVLWEKVMPADERNRVPAALTCLLILSAGKCILVDTGIGHKLSVRDQQAWAIRREEGDLIDSLARAGYAPSDIDIVINTHLHFDHCGGNTVFRDGVAVPTFPNAEYWVQRLEWADACYPDERTGNTYLAENLLPLQSAGQVRLLCGDTRVTEHVRCMVTRGHTRAHQSVVVESGGETAIFLGDTASLAVKMERLGWIAAFDTEPLETLERVRALRTWAIEKHALLFFEHDARVPMGRLLEKGGGFRVEAA